MIVGQHTINRAQGSAAGAVFAELAALCEAGTLRPVVTDIYPLSRATDALRDVQSGHHAGKVVLRVR